MAPSSSNATSPKANASRTPVKVKLPSLTGDLDAASVTAWVGLCEDSFEAEELMSGLVIAPALKILLAGLKLEAPAAAQWWSENRDTLKRLTTWDLFVTQLKDRFVPTTWKLDALSGFYSISQGSSQFLEFISKLQSARTALGSAGVGFTISDSIMKNHILFRANKLLRLRVCTNPNLDYGRLKVDTLISLMSTTWSSMIAEGVVHYPTSSSTSTSGKPSMPKLDRDALKAAGGCYHCGKTPRSPDWVQHNSRNCPGDKALGIPARKIQSATVAVVDSETDDRIAGMLEFTDSDEEGSVDFVLGPASDGAFSDEDD